MVDVNGKLVVHFGVPAPDSASSGSAAAAAADGAAACATAGGAIRRGYAARSWTFGFGGGGVNETAPPSRTMSPGTGVSSTEPLSGGRRSVRRLRAAAAVAAALTAAAAALAAAGGASNGGCGVKAAASSAAALASATDDLPNADAFLSPARC